MYNIAALKSQTVHKAIVNKAKSSNHLKTELMIGFRVFGYCAFPKNKQHKVTSLPKMTLMGFILISLGAAWNEIFPAFS